VRAGFRSRPFDAGPCLLCVDLQQEYAAPGRPMYGTADEATIAACRAVLDHARRHDWSVVHSVLEYDGGLFGRGGVHSRPVASLEPLSSEQVLVRDSLSVLAHPGAEHSALAQGGEVHVIGFSLSHSLLSTVFDAASCGLRMTLVEDAVGATALGGMRRAQVTALAKRLLAPFANFTTSAAVLARQRPAVVSTTWSRVQGPREVR
jgi:nicotinamidase-related amidase